MNKAFIGYVDNDFLSGKTVLVRVDYNVPLVTCANNNILIVGNDKRIQSSLTTINYLVNANAKVVLCSHLGRPKGNVVESLSLEPVATRLSKLLKNKSVNFINNCTGDWTQECIKNLQGGQILLLENLRFHMGEETNNSTFAAELSKGIDIFVNDAFGAAHRAHASTVGVTNYIPDCFIGFLMRDELKFLGESLNVPKRPLAAIIGGAKISSKVEVINNLLKKVDKLLIGGAMVYTFYKALGFKVGNSLVEDHHMETARTIMTTAESLNIELILACDSHIIKSHRTEITAAELLKQELLQVKDCRVVKSQSSESDVAVLEVSNEKIPEGYKAVDIGEKTIQLFSSALDNCETIVWNGPLGMFENELFSTGTNEMIKYLSGRTDLGAITVLCGGDTITALDSFDPNEKYSFTHISTGGGAALEFLGGRNLPGVDCIKDCLPAEQAK